MFYTKSKLPGGRTVKTEITDENVFTKCPECGRELTVHLGEIFSADNADSLDADIVCPECTRKYLKPTMEDIVLLTTALCRLGYSKQILRLYGKFGVSAIQELRVQDYGAYADALLSAVSKGGAV